MHHIKDKTWLAFWLVVPLIAGGLHPFVEGSPEYLKWLLVGISICVIFFSVVAHELAHGLAGRLCGDPTAENAGRLTCKPWSHVSVIGTVIVPIALHLINASFIFGWAKPVPFNPIKLRQFPRDQVLLAVAGPLSNFFLSYLSFALFLIFGFIFNQLYPESPISLTLDVFNPIVLASVPFKGFWFAIFEILSLGIVINLVLGVFNLIPFPPLDGSWILKSLLPKKVSLFLGKAQAAGFILLILALHFNLLDLFFAPVSVILVLFQFLSSYCLA